MALPNFLIIGAQKAGTTWLARMLDQHPDVYLPPEELHFFDKAFNFRRGIAWYERHFAAAADRSAVGEKTPDYLWAGGNGAEDHLPDVHHKIHRALPEAKLIVLLRNPVKRAVSALNHLVYTGRVSPLRRMDEVLIGRARRLVAGHGILEKGLYHRQLVEYRKLFSDEQFLHLEFERDVKREPEACLRAVCEFLGVDPEFRFDGIRRKINAPRRSRAGLAVDYHLPFMARWSHHIDGWLPAWKVTVREDTLNRLAEFYADENERLVDLLGYRPDGWPYPGNGETERA